MKNIDTPDILHSSKHTTIKMVEQNCVKLLNDEFPQAEQLQYLDNEYDYSYECDCRSIRKALGKKEIDGRKGVVFEYIEGTDLKELLTGRSKDISELLGIASSIADAINELHSHNITHNNICTENVLIEKGTDRVFLIDMSIASSVNQKLEDANNHIVHEACMHYLSPEQTGRINRVIDYRTDLYSLGVILYEMFTGQLPFTADDTAELIYAHVAKTPTAPTEINNALPKILSDIVIKLLSKNAEDRYQSASGLQDDLVKCKKHIESSGSIPEFELAANDFSGKLNIQQKLYGKEAQLKTLHKLFEHCRNGKKRVVVCGGSFR